MKATGSGPGGLPGTVDSAEAVLAATRTWLEQAVIGLQLCPFASSPYLNDRVRYCDIENFTNRLPYPMLHLLREAIVT